MLKNRIFASALIALACAAALTACTANNTDGNEGNPDGMGEQVSEIASDIKDSVGNPEKATHGVEKNTENEEAQQRSHREAVPFGK